MQHEMQHKIKKVLKTKDFFHCRWPDSNRHGVTRLILSQVRLPIPPQWHMRLHEKYHTILWKQMQEVFAKAHGKCA